MPFLASIIAAILPMLFYLIIVWRLDKYEREPFVFVITHFFWGAFGAILLGIVGTMALGFITHTNGIANDLSDKINTIIFAPFTEEIAKGVFLLWSSRSKKFDNITDGFVYGSAIGLGFGMTENLMYFSTYTDNAFSWLYLVIIRSLFSAVMHAISTGTFGAFIGMALLSRNMIKNSFPYIGLCIAFLIHFTWNFTVSFNNTYLLGFLFMIILIASYLLLFRRSLNNEKEIIQNELKEESNNGLLPQDHIPIIISRLHLRKGWINEEIRRLYSRTAIKLAFAKHKLKFNNIDRNKIELEIEYYRDVIRSLQK